MAFSDPKLKRWLNEYNRKYFNGELPSGMEVWWEAPGANIATVECDGSDVSFDESEHTFLIRINPAIAWSPRQAKFSLLHELNHIAVGFKCGHGAKFQVGMMRLAARGAFKFLW